MEEEKKDEEFYKEFKLGKDHMLAGFIGVLILAIFVSFATTGFGLDGITKSITNNKIDQKDSGQRGVQTDPEFTQDGSILIDSLIDDDISKGSKDAPIVVVEFSDFQCPFCAKFYSQTLSQIEKDYVETGKIQFVYRDYPLSNIHPYAQKAAESAECARDQGKFWEYHNLLFENQAVLSDSSLKQFASDLGLDSTQFNECLDSDKYYDETQKDLKDGTTIGIRGTPGFAVGKRGEKAQFISGARPYSSFKEVFDSLLNQ